MIEKNHPLEEARAVAEKHRVWQADKNSASHRRWANAHATFRMDLIAESLVGVFEESAKLADDIESRKDEILDYARKAAAARATATAARVAVLRMAGELSPNFLIQKKRFFNG